MILVFILFSFLYYYILPANICEKVAIFMFTTQRRSRARQGDTDCRNGSRS